MSLPSRSLQFMTRCVMTLSLLTPLPVLAQQPAIDPPTPSPATTSTSPLALSWRAAYDPAPEAVLEAVSSRGLTAEALRLIDEPETPNAVRIMLLDGAARAKGADETARKLLRYFQNQRGGGPLSLEQLSAEQAMMLGFLAARAHPDTLAPLGGESEVEKLSPLMLLTAATSRRRGDMTGRLVLAMIKAEQAMRHPEEALCAPEACLDQAVAPFAQEWSVHPDLVCAFAEAVRPEKGASLSKVGALCADRGRSSGAPRFVEQARQEDRERSAALQQAPPSSTAPYGGMIGGPPSALAMQQELMMVQVAISELERERANLPPFERLILDQMLNELRRYEQLLAAQIASSSPPASSPSAAPPSGVAPVIPPGAAPPATTSPPAAGSAAPGPVIERLERRGGELVL